MIVSLIVAAGTNNAIGKDNQLLWHLPKDLQFFKQTTWAMPVVMGRKTFESLGGNIDGDTFFPEIDSSDFALSNEVTHAAHEKHAYGFSFQTWLRK